MRAGGFEGVRCRLVSPKDHQLRAADLIDFILHWTTGSSQEIQQRSLITLQGLLEFSVS